LVLAPQEDLRHCGQAMSQHHVWFK
jgi:hypothetical protein